MNNARRKRIKEAIKMMNLSIKLNDFDAMDYGRDIISDIFDEEQYSYDNIPDSLQYSNRAIKSYEAIESLEKSLSQIEWITEEKFKNKKEVKEAIDYTINILKEIL